MERQFHDWLREHQTPKAGATESAQIADHFAVDIGIGDDGAVVNFAGHPLVITTDAIAEGTHFELPKAESGQGRVAAFERIGRKALAVSLSDIAAMGASPVAATLSFQCPSRLTIDDLKSLYNGANQLAEEYNLTIVGGDTNTWKNGLVVSSTAFGTRDRQLTGWSLDGAKLGDAIYVSGAFGGSIYGRHFDFEPRLRLASYLAGRYQVNSVTDVSDSLTSDLMAIARSSQVAFEIDLKAVPISEDVQQSDRKSALEHALSDGEDFELAFTVPTEVALQLDNANDLPTPITRIGTVQDGTPSLYDCKGQSIPVSGYDH